MIGTVRNWKEDRGFGFVRPDDGSKDVFFHISALDKAFGAKPKDGDRVAFETEDGPKGTRAKAVKRA